MPRLNERVGEQADENATLATAKQYDLIEALLGEINDTTNIAIPPSYTASRMEKTEASDYINYLKDIKAQENGRNGNGNTQTASPVFSAVKHGLSVKLAQREMLFERTIPSKAQKQFAKRIQAYYDILIATEANAKTNGGGSQ